MTDSIPSPRQGSCVRLILHSIDKDLRACFILHFLGKDSCMLHCANASNSDWGDPWVDPQGILGGSNPNSGDPATLTRVKIGGSSETTSPFYNIKKGYQ